MAQDKFLVYLNELRKSGINAPKIKQQQLHLLLTAYLTALFEPVVHNYPYEEANEALSTLEKFFLPGWKEMMGIGHKGCREAVDSL